MRCEELAQAEEAILAISRWEETPDALHWLTVARYRLRGLTTARTSLFTLAWRQLGRLASVLTELADELLDRDWRAFQCAYEWEGFE